MTDQLAERTHAAMRRAASARGGAPHWVPVKRLGRRHLPAIAQHLLKLSPQDRYLRFGHPASDEQIGRYVEGLDLAHDDVFGVFNRQLALVAWIHLAYPPADSGSEEAELGISVGAHLRGTGLGKRLFEHAMLLARNRGIATLRIHALAENKAMLHIARAAGAEVERFGFEAEAAVRLPPGGLVTRCEAWVEDRAAGLDYTVKQWAFSQPDQAIRNTN